MVTVGKELGLDQLLQRKNGHRHRWYRNEGLLLRKGRGGRDGRLNLLRLSSIQMKEDDDTDL